MGSIKKLLTTIASIFIGTALILIYIVPPQQVLESQSPYILTSANKDKKKVLIFSSRGGGGHISVMQAIEQYLQEDFCVGHSFVFADVLGRLDPAQKILNGKVSGEDWYNLLMRKKWYQLTNLTYSFGSWYYNFCRKSVEPLIEKYLATHKPDLIISVIPLINNLILNVAKKMNIPFVLVPTDLDATIAMNGIHNPQYENFYLVLSYPYEAIHETFKKAHVDKQYISYAGFPVKKEFFEPHNYRAIKKEFDIPEDKPVILLLMGAQGSRELYEFSKQLAKLEIPAHLIIVLGKSEHLRKSFNRITFPKNISTTILGFTDRIPDLMHIADLFITKSGSVSVNEALYAQLPMLLDGTTTVMQWEQFNHQFIVKNQFGAIIKKSYKIPTMVTRLLTNKIFYENMKRHLAAFDKKNPEQEIKMLVRKILAN
jgi:UDP-N-acetylglucosamine:LPS N-acetylglucosamine transferase